MHQLIPKAKKNDTKNTHIADETPGPRIQDGEAPLPHPLRLKYVCSSHLFHTLLPNRKAMIQGTSSLCTPLNEMYGAFFPSTHPSPFLWFFKLSASPHPPYEANTGASLGKGIGSAAL